MKHLKIFEEELTDWTKDLFNLYTLIQANVPGDAISTFTTIQDFSNDFLKMLDKIGIKGEYLGYHKEGFITNIGSIPLQPPSARKIYMDYKIPSEYDLISLYDSLPIYTTNNGQKSSFPTFIFNVSQLNKKNKEVIICSLSWNSIIGCYRSDNQVSPHIKNYKP